ncbi:MAG: glycoside hydrolase family 2, partial [Verrucomicrobia bacterium]|nr:glycoside hydrolase family 2 [Verrucomicrobiota bacterium]
RGFLTRNQAHGSPGNLLDLYALADIPETEMFHTDRRPLVSKFASSAAHVAGKRLVASETGTWLKEHFTETLADVQGLLDDLFVSGINHVIFHGTCYSPDEAGWPGWLFYASTEMNPRNSIWRDVPALAAYVARCQSVLQSGRPDNDVLVYWPIHDTWHDARGLQMPLSVHGAGWFGDEALGKLAGKLWARGFTFDYISDRQLAGAKAVSGSVAVPGGNYRAVVVPACEHMPLATMEKLLALADGGVLVIFEDHLPTDVPGLGDLERRRAELKKLLARAQTGSRRREEAEGDRAFTSSVSANPPPHVGGYGRVLVGDVESLLTKAGVARESLVDRAGLLFIRRAFEGGRHYFIANRGEQPLDGWVTLATKAASVAIMDPMTGRAGVGAVRDDRRRRREEANDPSSHRTDSPPHVGAYGTEVYLQLQPGESVILRAFAEHRLQEPAWTYWRSAGQPAEITGTWQVKFIAGGPVLPPAFETTKLASW